MMSIRLGAAPINWCNDDFFHLTEPIELEKCLQEIRESGYTGTELSNLFPRDSKDILTIKKNYDLSIISWSHSTFFLTSTSLSKELDKLEEKLNFLSKIGANCINLFEKSYSIYQKNISLDKKHNLSTKEWGKLLYALSTAANMCHNYGIKLAYHHHMGTVIQNIDEIEKLIVETDKKKLFICLDTGHLIYAGIDPIWFYEKHASRVAHIHFKDIRKNILIKMGYSHSFLAAITAGIFTVPGDGFMPFANFIKSLKSNNYTGWCIVEVEQDSRKNCPFTYAKKAHQYLSAFTDVT